jgi:hypothetical protein
LRRLAGRSRAVAALATGARRRYPPAADLAVGADHRWCRGWPRGRVAPLADPDRIWLSAPASATDAIE